MGATYRSHIDADIEGKSTFSHVEPLLSSAITDTDGEADFRLPAQATVGVAYQINPSLVIEAGVRWEDWKSFKELRIDLDNPVLGRLSISRHATGSRPGVTILAANIRSIITGPWTWVISMVKMRFPDQPLNR